MLKVAGYVLISAIVCTAAITAAGAGHGLGSGRQVGQTIGGAGAFFLFGLAVAGTVRFIRRRSGDPTRGAFSGIIATVVFAALQYVGATSG